MIAVSGEALNKNIRSNLEKVFGAYDDTLWRLFAYDPLAEEYVEATDANLDRFDDEFRLTPGMGFWLISRSASTIEADVLSYDDGIGSVFYTVLEPGWNIVSHPWDTVVELPVFRLEASDDLINWVEIKDLGNDLVSHSYYQFRGNSGSPGNWYEEIAFDQCELQPNQSYWVRNEKSYPVILRIVKLLATASLQRMEPPDAMQTLVAKYGLERWINHLVPECIASAANTLPPDPPGVAGTEDGAIGTSGGGGGGCFISTAGEGMGSGAVFFVFMAGLAVIAVLRRRDARDLKPEG
jgi:hypothetical protein